MIPDSYQLPFAQLERTAPLFSFEGPEGSGKTTAANKLATYLVDQGYDIMIEREPGGTRIGERVRNVLLDMSSVGMASLTELLLMEASRVQLTEEKIVPAMKQGRIVLLDRFYDASNAYQGAGRGIDQNLVTAMNTLATGGLVPDRSYFVMVTVKEGLNRINRDRKDKVDRFDKELIEFHHRLHAGYENLAKQQPDRIKVIDGMPAPEIVFETVKNDVMSYIGTHYSHLLKK